MLKKFWSQCFTKSQNVLSAVFVIPMTFVTVYKKIFYVCLVGIIAAVFVSGSRHPWIASLLLIWKSHELLVCMSMVLEPRDKDRTGYHTSGTTDFGNILVSLAQLHLGQQLWMSASLAKSRAGSKSLSGV